MSISIPRPADAEPAVLPPTRAGASPSAGEPRWLTGGSWPLFAWVHHPRGQLTGVTVLCPPLLSEHSAGYHLYRWTALSLAERGVLVVRFDYEGTGDSGGPTGGPGRLAAWLDGVDRAVDEARRQADGPLALVGVRSGALIAAAAAQRRRDVDALLLWDPWTTGRAFLRRQRALHTMHVPVSGLSGEVEVPGFVVDADTSAEVSGLRLPGSLSARRAVMVVRPRTAAAPLPLAQMVGGSSAPTTAQVLEAEPGEQEALFDVEPLERRLPLATAARAVDWLARTLDDLAGPSKASPVRRADDGGGADGTTVIPAAGTGEATVYEQAVRLGDHGLFAIETRPGPSPGGFPLVVFLTSGPEPHTGPSRLWVTLARRWASEGARCLRVDLSGWGESAARPGRPDLVLRAPEAFDDVTEVVAAAGADPRATVLVGLCSGAYQALESALELLPLGVMAVNPLLRFTPPELVDSREVSPRRRICDPRPPWVGGARRRVPMPVQRVAVALRGAVRRAQAPAPGRSWLDRLGEAGVHVYCVVGEGELRQLPAAAGPSGPGSSAGDLVRVDLVPGLDHALLPAVQRREVEERLTDELRTIVQGVS